MISSCTAARGGGAQLGGVRRDRARRCARSSNDETLLVQSGKPVAVFRTHASAPRVLIANSNLVGRWATWDDFRELERMGLTMYGQMTAGSWIYIGSQGIVQGTYETFGAVARTALRRLARRALRAHGGARRHGRRAAARRDDARRGGPRRRSRRVAHRQAARDAATAIARRTSLDEALAWIDEAHARAARRSRSGWSAMPPTCCPSSCARGVVPDVLTDQTSAHDMLERLRARRACRSSEALALRARDPGEYVAALDRIGRRARARDARAAGARARSRSTTATTFAPSRSTPAWTNAFDIPGLRSGVHAPAVLRGEGSVPLGRALRRSRGHRTHRRARARALPARRASRAAGSRSRASGSHFRGCRRASAGWGRASARGSASRSTISSRAVSSRRRS